MVKAIDALDVDFESGVNLLYGPNGIGKSTVLEVLSLLGHLHHMTFVKVVNGRVASAEPDGIDAELLDRIGQAGHDLGQEFGRSRGHGLGTVLFTVRDGAIDGGRAFDVPILLLLPRDPRGASLTSLLSTAFTDAYLSRHAAIVAEPHSEASLRQLIGRVSCGTDRPRGDGAILVSYVNTDLNDFGRGNDLRESPKDLHRDFCREIRGRLQIPFTGVGGSLQRLDELNRILQVVLKYPPLFVRGMTSRDAAFRISSCRIDDAGTLTFTATRLADNYDSATLDFLSAGENECVFIFTLLLHLPLRGGLVLLDEPDLHVGPFQKRDLFAQIYEILEKAGCQAVIATHSEYALAGFPRLTYRVIRPVVECTGTDYYFRYVADTEIDLRLAHTKLLLARALRSLRHTGAFGMLRFAAFLRNFRAGLAQAAFRTSFALVMVILSLLVLSGASDLVLTRFGQSVFQHEKLADRLVSLLVPASIALVGSLICVFVGSAWTRRQERILLERALEAKKRRLEQTQQR